MFNKILEYAGPYKKKMFQASVVMFLGVLMSILPFMLAYQIITPLVTGESIETSYVMVRVLGVLLCLILNACFYAKGLSMSHYAAYNTLLKLRVSLQIRMEKLPFGVIQEKGVGTIKKLFVDDVDSMELLLAHALPEGFANVMIPIVMYIAMFIVDWKLALLSLASLPVSMMAMMIMYSLGTNRMGDYYKSAQIMNNTIIEYINGMEVVKVFNKVGESYKRYQKDVCDYRDFTLNWYKACWPWMAIYNSLLPCTIILTLPLGSWFVLQGYSSLPDLILILCLSLSIGIPLLKAIGFLPTLPQLNYKISSLEKLLSEEPLKQTIDEFHGKNHSIVFNEISFAYEEQTVINKLSLTVKEGQMTALVGESGSGKSTLAKLLVHYYDVNQGTITIGGQNICDMSLESLNNQIAYVSQEQYLFNTSLLENIRIGRLSASDEEVMEAARKAQCMEFIEKLPKGIYTLAGDSGKQLSGGERQRIALARAILKDAPIIVLDEATAFADPENEEKMEAAISQVVKGKTLLVIAHRLSSIMNADQICVMNKGSLIATGKHKDLIKSCKKYEKLWIAAQESAQWKVEKEVKSYAATI